MAELSIENTGDVITAFVSFAYRQETNRITHKALDGRQYMQRIGNPVITYSIIVYVNEQGKDRLMQADDTGELLKIRVKSGDYLGRILELKEFEKLPAGFYKTTAILAAETEA